LIIEELQALVGEGARSGWLFARASTESLEHANCLSRNGPDRAGLP
jgi:hypothetical protein